MSHSDMFKLPLEAGILQAHFSRESNRPPCILKQAAGYINTPGLISLGGGLPSSEYFPISEIAMRIPTPPNLSEKQHILSSPASTEQIARIGKYDTGNGTSDYDISIAFNYGQTTGSPQMVRWITEHVDLVYNPPYADWAVCLTVGSTGALEQTVRMLCDRSRNDSILTEEYTFATAMETFVPQGIKTFGVKMDEEGLLPSHMDHVLATWDEEARGARKPHLLYTVPSGQNPTGATQSLERRREIYSVCQKHNIFIIEDEPYYFIQMKPYTGRGTEVAESETVDDFLTSLVPSYLSMDSDGRVLRMDSFSKVLVPGSRMGWITASNEVIQKYLCHAEVANQGPSGISQLIVWKLVDETWGHEGYIKWLINLRTNYTRRRNALLAACEDYLPTDIVSWTPPAAGMFLWLRLDHIKHPDYRHRSLSEIEEEIFQHSIKQGVLFARGSWFRAEAHKELNELFLRVTFASAAEEEIITPSTSQYQQFFSLRFSMADQDPTPTYRGAPFPTKWRRNHPRSKNGCLTCRTKRKKCDEVKPVCSSCTRTGQECAWPTQENTSHRPIPEDGSPHEPPGAPGPSTDSAALQSTSTSSSPRAAPTYGNLVNISDNSRPLYQQYLDITAEMLTRGPCLDGNPFIHYLLPLAATDTLVLDCILAIGGAHLTVNDTTSTIQRARALEVATRGHYATVLAGLQKLLSYETGQIILPDEHTGRSTPIRVLLILLLLCVYDHVQGHSRGSMYHHLKACRQYINLLTSEPTPSDELKHLKGFILELYAYHAIKITITPRSFLSDEVVEIDPSVYSLDILRGYRSRGFLLGFGQGLWEMVPEISQLVEARREEETRGIVATTAFQEQYDSLLTRLEGYNAFEEDANGLCSREEQAAAVTIYQHGLIIYLQSTFHLDMLADPNLAAQIDNRVEHTMSAFYSLFVSESPYRRMLLWPGTIMASVARRQEHIRVFRAGFSARAARTPGAKHKFRFDILIWEKSW
ncbi:aromatic amino acid aminotransferase I [Fusarium denticulatum]|uniref:aromatic-amino-acid transaminase n=1 Tax=Fusarium denticulatum TaxID=48507 RepID=A0A8H5TAQ3_9HYPO|nr:aromatic amino acid aminotransferase I [Fusarium denticulatum]